MSNPLHVCINVMAEASPQHRVDSERSSVPAPHAAFSVEDDWSTPISTLDFAVATTSVAEAAEATPFQPPSPAAPIAEPVVESDLRPETDVVGVESAPLEGVQEETVEEVDTPAQRPTLPPLSPVWEVDRFRWPAISGQLFEREDAYFQHAGQKLFEASQQGLRVLAVASAGTGAGCTTLAICLARAVAQAGGRVALLDGDPAHPQLANYLGLSFSNGWQNVAEGKSPWVEAAVSSLDDGIAVLPAVSRQQFFDAAATPGIPGMLQSISENFDLLIVDLGQLAQDISFFLGSGNDCVANAAIIVRDMRSSSETDTLDIATQLRLLGVQAVGIAENFRDQESATAAA